MLKQLYKSKYEKICISYNINEKTIIDIHTDKAQRQFIFTIQRIFGVLNLNCIFFSNLRIRLMGSIKISLYVLYAN